MSGTANRAAGDRPSQILDAALAVLARDGISGISMRKVAQKAGLSLGLANYHFTDKHGLIIAALERIADADAAIVRADPTLDAEANLRRALRHVAADEFLGLDYLALRLQLWSLAGVDPDYAAINQRAQGAYLSGLEALLAAARPELDHGNIRERAEDILVVQNGVWLTSVLIPDRATMARAVARTERIAFS
ncbi:MAG: TetR/AcrR family transcriptional regulator [Actinomycetota bacterium]